MHAFIERRELSAVPATLPWRWLLMGAALPAAMLLALCIGRYGVPLSHVVAMLTDTCASGHGGPHGMPVCSAAEHRVLFQVRLPRVLLSALVGAGLAMCGSALQGIFRNPLVGPQILGISSGAAFGGCLAILLFSSLTATLGMAFTGGLLSTAIVYVLGRSQGRTTVLMLVLAGVMCGSFFGALTTLVTYFADPNDTLPAVVFWLMGSFATASYVKLAAAAVPALFGMGMFYALRFRINVLSLGDEQAGALGVAVEPLRWTLLVCVALVSSSSVAVSGTVGWVGLVVPHIARLIVGADHRSQLPAAALVGGAYMVLVDTVARSLTSAEIPLSVITALLGAPLFAGLLRKAQRKGFSHD